MSLARARALVVIGVLAFIAVVTVVWAIVTDDQTHSHADLCAVAATPSVPPPTKIKLRIYNGTDQQGLAMTLRKELQSRGFTVVKVGNDPLNEPVTGSAQIRYGPSGTGAAQQVRAQFPGSQIVDDDRTETTVDVVIGAEYSALTPKGEVAKTLSNLEPIRGEAPAGC
jgi:hypothetical protein